jgi:hypothetical protein
MGIIKKLLGEKRFLVFLTKRLKMINAVIYSYKNKNLLKVIKSLFKNTNSEIYVTVFDQHPINRKDLFLELPQFKNISYNHIFWDSINSPCEKKADVLSSTNSDHFLIMSDDVILKNGWDLEAIAFVKNAGYIISGHGQTRIKQKDKFSFEKESLLSDDYTQSGIIDRNFVFGKTTDLQSCTYPFDLKYYGEEEIYSLRLFKANKKIFSAPSNFYSNLNLNTLESLYTPFSKEHGNHSFIKELKNSSKNFLEFHNINLDQLFFLPYATDDVGYDPERLNFQDIDARKFIENIKTIS